MEERKQITEEMKIHEDWYKLAKEQTLETLPEFVKNLTESYSHDYGTICHAMAAASIATIWAMNKTEQGGITGFQAGVVMWEFIHHWMYESNKIGLRIVNYDNMLFPQHEKQFAKKINRSTWRLIQNEAIKKIETRKECHPRVFKHWKSIEAGIVPFGYKVEDE